MKQRNWMVLLSLVLATGLLLALPNLYAQKGGKKKTSGGSIPLDLHFYDSVVDEHDTTAFYDNGVQYCPGSTTPIQGSLYRGDGRVVGPTTAYDFSGSPWTAVGGLSSTTYVNGADCDANCLRAELISNSKIVNLDTRGTSGPRTLFVDFREPCTDPGCPPAGSANVFDNGTITTVGLLNVGLTFPFTSMEVCSSTACPEAQHAFAKFWFPDPNDPKTEWRVDWQFLRVLRMSAATWYVIADACDGTQIAGLSELQGKRSRPKEVFNGSYKIPFFLAVVQQ